VSSGGRDVRAEDGDLLLGGAAAGRSAFRHHLPSARPFLSTHLGFNEDRLSRPAEKRAIVACLERQLRRISL
jgi:hypothetical protein